MNEPITILTIDDEPNNLRALRLDLEDQNYNVMAASRGLEGLEVLQQHCDKIQVVLLDRMMPDIDGITFMKKLKQIESLKYIPVIMQTAAAGKEQMIEGINAGVYYYLTKPYEKEIMLSIVSAALNDYFQHNKLMQDITNFKNKLHLIKTSIFELQTIEEAEYLATFIANFFPSPENAVVGIFELIMNAIEHGNLGITYEEKTELFSNGTWHHELRKRLAIPANLNKKVNINYSRMPDRILLRIKDAGDGFDWEKYLTISPERATHSHGRGVALAKTISFDHIEYIGNGNEVLCTVMLD